MRLTAAVDATLLDDARSFAATLAFGPADLQTFVPGWQDANGTAFYAASWEASDEWIAGAQFTLDRPAWDEEPYQINLTGAERAQQALVIWFPSDNKPLPQATEGVLTVIGGMAPLDAMAAMGLERVQEEV